MLSMSTKMTQLVAGKHIQLVPDLLGWHLDGIIRLSLDKLKALASSSLLATAQLFIVNWFSLTVDTLQVLEAVAEIHSNW